MAQSRAPYVQTNESKRIPFALNPLQRSGTVSKDAQLVNMMVDVVKGPKEPQIYVKSRAGLSVVYNTATGEGRGLHDWVVNGTHNAIAVVGNKIYTNGVALSTTLAGSTGGVGFCEHVASTGVVTLVMVDGTDGYVFTAPAVAPTKITDVNFPTPHIPSVVFMDGYVFVAKANSEDIYNCALDTPLIWTVTGSPMFISAEMYPDMIVGLAKNNNYVYAVGRTSVEYFYDAGTATGSPLARQAPAVQQFGSAAQGSIVQTETEVLMVGDTVNGGKTIWSIDGFKSKEIATTPIRSILNAEAGSIASANAYCVRVSGQKCYVIVLSSRTIVYCFDTEMWSEWNSGATGGTRFLGFHGDDGPNGTPYLLDASNGKVYTMSEFVFTDAGTAFQCQIITEKQDFGTFNRKTCSRLSVVGDVPDDNGVYNNVSVSWSDDDYKTWVTDRTLVLNGTDPYITQLGSFRRRAFRFKYNQPALFRVEAFEVDINKGSQ